MRILNILIILGCLVGGYWLISSIVSPGIDVTRRERPEDASPGQGTGSPPDRRRDQTPAHGRMIATGI